MRHRCHPALASLHRRSLPGPAPGCHTRVPQGFSHPLARAAGVSQVLVNPRFGIASGMTALQFWGVFAAINIALHAAGSWWIFNRLVRDEAPRT
jgi:hypothetical protein